MVDEFEKIKVELFDLIYKNFEYYFAKTKEALMKPNHGFDLLHPETIIIDCFTPHRSQI